MASGVKEEIFEAFAVKEQDLRTYSPLTLAYIGDAIFDLVVRTVIVGRANMPAQRLHQYASHIVKASSQAKLMAAIEPYLNDAEREIYRRGRNAKSYTHAKNASIIDYRIATAFETLMGWHYLQGHMDRIITLTQLGLEGSGLRI